MVCGAMVMSFTIEIKVVCSILVGCKNKFYFQNTHAMQAPAVLAPAGAIFFLKSWYFRIIFEKDGYFKKKSDKIYFIKFFLFFITI